MALNNDARRHVLLYPDRLKTPFLKKKVALLYNITRAPKNAHRYSTFLQSLSYNVRMRVWQKTQSLEVISPLSLSADAESALAELRKNGVVKINRDFSAVADYINETYASPNNELSADSSLRDHGFTVYRSIPLTDSKLFEILFDPDLCAMICHYYGRQAYYRDYPTVTKEVVNDASKKLISGVYHSDGFHQVSFMLLLNDLSMKDIHMEYAMGSHLDLQPSYNRWEIDQEQVAKEFQIAHVVGRKGSLFIFDSEGLHRRGYRPHSTRAVFQINITPGVYLFTDPKYPSVQHILGNRRYSAHVRGFLKMAAKKHND